MPGKPPILRMSGLGLSLRMRAKKKANKFYETKHPGGHHGTDGFTTILN
jgi:hypothetical protein